MQARRGRIGKLQEWAPVTYAGSWENSKTPTLVIAGELTTACRTPIAGIFQCAAAQGVPSKLVVFPDEGTGC